MRKKIITVSFLCLMMVAQAGAKKIQPNAGNPPHELAPRMDAMLENIFEMEMMATGSKPVHYENLNSHAEKMLNVIRQISSQDQDKKFSPFLQTLENDTKRLSDLAKKQDKRALDYVDRIYESCFQCHSAHREKPKF